MGFKIVCMWYSSWALNFMMWWIAVLFPVLKSCVLMSAIKLSSLTDFSWFHTFCWGNCATATSFHALPNSLFTSPWHLTVQTLYMKNVVKLTRNEILNVIKHILWSPLKQTVNMQLFNNPFVVKEQKHLLQYHTNCDYNLTWAGSG
jgi:hypothetical protein